MRRLAATIVAPMLAASALLVLAGGVAADEPQFVYVDAYFCTASDGQGTDYDTNALPPGSEIVLLGTWGAKTQGQLQGFLENVSWVMTADGQPLDVVVSWEYRWGPGYWGEVVLFGAGVLASGQAMHTHFDAIVKAATFDGWSVYKQGSVYGGGVDCTVTAA